MEDAILTINKYKHLFGDGEEINITDGVKEEGGVLSVASKLDKYNNIILYGGFDFERTFDYSKMSEEEIIAKVWVLNLFLLEKYVTKDKNIACLLTDRTITIEEKKSILLSEQRHNKTIEFFKDHLSELIVSNVPLDENNFYLLFNKNISEYDILYLI